MEILGNKKLRHCWWTKSLMSHTFFVKPYYFQSIWYTGLEFSEIDIFLLEIIFRSIFKLAILLLGQKLSDEQMLMRQKWIVNMDPPVAIVVFYKENPWKYLFSFLDIVVQHMWRASYILQGSVMSNKMSCTHKRTLCSYCVSSVASQT